MSEIDDAARTQPQTDQRQILPGSRIGSDPNVGGGVQPQGTGVQPQGTGAGPVGVGTAGADTFGLDFAPAEGGLLISRIAPGSYWPQLGLRHGDLLTSVNGVPVTTAAEFQRILANLQPGARLPVVISRDGARQTIYVVGREQRGFRPLDYDDRSATPRTRGWLGVYLDARYDQHAVVDGIEVGSTADQVGLRTGDWIVAVNGQRVRSPAHLSQMISTLEPGTRIEVQVSRRDVREMEMTVGNWPTTTRYRYEDASERTGPSGQEGSERTEPSGQEGAESRSETESDTPQQNREGEGSENNP